MPLLLLILIILIISAGQFIPHDFLIYLLSLSLAVKSLIIFLLPFIIFSLLFNAASKLAHDASKIILIIFTGVVISNFIATSMAQIIGIIIYQFDLKLSLPSSASALEAAPIITFPNLIKNQYAMAGAVIIGTIFGKITPNFTKKVNYLLDIATNFMFKLITILIPIFVAGFAGKLQHEGVISQIFKNYTLIFIIIAGSQTLYVSTLYLISNNFSLSATLVSVKNMLPAGLSGFSTMSSAASMPLTILEVEKNAKNKDLVHTVIPATVNIHLIGDCIAIPCFAYAILKSYCIAEPDFYSYIIFTIYFVLAKFSVAAIPGGGIIVMLPILEQYLSFNNDMLSLITALYILFDPIITGVNILGNGAFAGIIDKLFYKYTRNR